MQPAGSGHYFQGEPPGAAGAVVCQAGNSPLLVGLTSLGRRCWLIANERVGSGKHAEAGLMAVPRGLLGGESGKAHEG